MSKVIAWVSFAGIAVMVVLTILDVALSKTINSPVKGTFEIVERVMIATVFCAFAYGQTRKTHINMTMIIGRFPVKIRMMLFALMSFLSVAASGIMTYAAILQTLNSIKMNYQTAVLKIPFWPFYLIEGIGMAAFTLTLLYDAILSTGAVFRKDYYDVITESWD